MSPGGHAGVMVSQHFVAMVQPLRPEAEQPDRLSRVRGAALSFLNGLHKALMPGGVIAFRIFEVLDVAPTGPFLNA